MDVRRDDNMEDQTDRIGRSVDGEMMNSLASVLEFLGRYSHPQYK